MILILELCFFANTKYQSSSVALKYALILLILRGVHKYRCDVMNVHEVKQVACCLLILCSKKLVKLHTGVQDASGK